MTGGCLSCNGTVLSCLMSKVKSCEVWFKRIGTYNTLKSQVQNIGYQNYQKIMDKL